MLPVTWVVRTPCLRYERRIFTNMCERRRTSRRAAAASAPLPWPHVVNGHAKSVRLTSHPKHSLICLGCSCRLFDLWLKGSTRR